MLKSKIKKKMGDKLTKNICCIGAGYVGGPTMAVIASNCSNLKIDVVDINKERIDAWNSNDLSKIPVYEKDLPQIIKECRGKNLFFSTNVEKSISEADIIFISVNTPTKKRGLGAGFASDLKWIESSARIIAQFATAHTIVVEKSTLPVKTAETIKSILHSAKVKNQNNDKNSSKTFSIVSNPEFLAEGSAINDLQNPDRVLIGGEDEESIECISAIYENWVEKKKIIKTNLWSSELSKLVANAFLAQRISSINSISALCETTGANIKEVSKAIGTDSRIGTKFLNPGPGFGGSCFKKDILNLVYLSRYYGLDEVANYWEQVVLINKWQQKRISKIVINKLFGTITNKRLAIFGFSFKANTNDTRESPSISIAKDLLEEGAELAFYDPQVSKEQILAELSEFEHDGKIAVSQTPLEAVLNADAILVLTEWDQFNNLNWLEIYREMRKPAWIFDTRVYIKHKHLREIGFRTWILGSN
jgi:UDPglucose 6-dehydrogenase